ncbi:actin 6B, partial [Brachionus plicatilis]
MSGGIIGGDEVGALVLDVGSYTTRAGYAGEDMPKADFPSYYGVIEEYTDKTESMDTSANGISNGEIIKAESKSEKKYFLDSMSIRTPKPNMNVQSFVKDGLIDDWDTFEKVLDYTFGKHLHCDPSNHPILFTEPV